MEKVVEMPLKTWRRLEKVMDMIEAEQVEWINEEEACVLLGRGGRRLSNSRLQRMRREGIIPFDYYTRGVNGAYFFDKKKLMGLEKK